MNEIDPNKYTKIINKKNIINENKKTSYIKNFFIRIFIIIILFLSLMIVTKKNDNLKDKIYNYVYKEDISFTKIKKIYNKYLGGVLPLKKETNTEKVFSEKLTYTEKSKYNDGVKLTVTEDYLVPSLSEGMVVFVGDKEDYGNTIIIEDLNGMNTWYSNIENTSLKMYDYINKGDYIGNTKGDNLYLVFSKDDKFLDYEKYIN